MAEAAPIELNGVAKFETEGDATRLHQTWERWVQSFELFAMGKGVKNIEQKKALLLHCAGQNVQDIFFTLPAGEGDDDEYVQTKNALSVYFKGKINVPYERYCFRKMTQGDETIDQLITRLKRQVKLCNFDNEDEQIRDQIIEKCKSHKLRTRLLEKGDTLTLKDLRTIAQTMEMSETHAQRMESGQTPNTSSSVNWVSFKQKPRNRSNDKQTCYRCGNSSHFGRDLECPARDKECTKCGFTGHFAKKCNTKPENYKSKGGNSHNAHEQKADRRKYKPPRHFNKRGKVNVVEEDSDDDEYAFKVTQGSRSESIKLQVDNTVIDFVIDSGATVNIIDRALWEQLKEKHIKCVSEKTDKKLYAYGSDAPLKLMGKFTANVKVPETDREKMTEIYVMDGKGQALLGKPTAIELGVLHVGLRVNNVTDTENAVANYPECFDGIGKLEGYQLKLHINENVTPVAQSMYRVPYSLREKVSAKIEELETMDIIEKVENPSAWVSPVIVVPKPDGDIRLCVDMRRANEAIKRERHPIPTVDEIMYNMNGSAVFSKLDLKYGYHQIELEEESRHITTFVTHKGLYRYKRLMFGISSAPEQYQHIISQVFHDCEGVQNISDDIVVHGKDQEEHDRRLEQTLERLRERKLTLNEKKCKFGMDKIVFMGHIVSKLGLEPTKGRIDAIVNATTPKNAAEVRSFLGLVNFSARYIPNLAAVCEPLRTLTRQGVNFEWGIKQQESFERLKESLTNAETLGHFRLDAKTTVVTDACNVGLGAVLLQEDETGNAKVISYASRALSAVERRYSTTEKEALAVVWACEKFRLYLQGVEFNLVTDHKPLEVLYSRTSKPNARIERWIMKLMPYNFTVRYAPGKGNIADALSRLVDTRCDEGQTKLERDTESFVRFVAREATPTALSTREIEEASKDDQELSDVRDCLNAKYWDKSSTPYFPVKEELSQLGYLVLRGTRIVVPETLRLKCVELAHQGHLGIVGTKQQLRTKVWWPHMDKDVEKYVKSCHGCQIVDGTTRSEPISPTPLPLGPWQDLAIDLMGPLPTNHYVLVVVDYYSRYYEIVVTKDISTENIIDSLEDMFSKHGLPCSITSDNGPQFISAQFAKYLEENGIQHRRVTPLHPAANGEVERQNRSLLKRIKIAHSESKDWKRELRTYLLAYRSTPHATTGKSPAEMMFNRKLRTKLPQIDELSRPLLDEEIREQDGYAKHQNKVYIDRKRAAKESELGVGDTVLLRQKTVNKFSTPFSSNPYTLIAKNGNSCTVERNGVRYKRNSTFVKKYNPPIVPLDDANDETDVPPEPFVETNINREPIITEPLREIEPNARPIRERKEPKRFEDYVVRRE